MRHHPLHFIFSRGRWSWRETWWNLCRRLRCQTNPHCCRRSKPACAGLVRRRVVKKRGRCSRYIEAKSAWASASDIYKLRVLIQSQIPTDFYILTRSPLFELSSVVFLLLGAMVSLILSFVVHSLALLIVSILCRLHRCFSCFFVRTSNSIVSLYSFAFAASFCSSCQWAEAQV